VGSGEKWRWADPQGIQRVLHSDELRSALASGALPPYTLVWREGMSEWQPAYLVAELATMAISAQTGVIPNIPPPPLAMVAVQAEFEKRKHSFDEPAKAEKNKKQEAEPPPPPVHRYDAIAAAVPAHVMQAAARQAAQNAAAAASAAAKANANAAPKAGAPAAGAPSAAKPAPSASAVASPTVRGVGPAAAPKGGDLKTWVAGSFAEAPPPAAGASTEGAASPKPSPVVKKSTPPKPPVVAPPRAAVPGSAARPEPAAPVAAKPVTPAAAKPVAGAATNAGAPAAAKPTAPVATKPAVPPRAAEPPRAPEPIRPSQTPRPVSAPPPLPLPAPSSSPPHSSAAHAGPAANRAANEPLTSAPPHVTTARSAPPPPPRFPGPGHIGQGLSGVGPPPRGVPPPHVGPPPPVRPSVSHPSPSSGNGEGLPIAPLPSSPLAGSAAGESSAPDDADLPAFPLDDADLIDDDQDKSPAGVPLTSGIVSRVVGRVRRAGTKLGPLATQTKDKLRPLAAQTKEKFGPLATRGRKRITSLSAQAKEGVTKKLGPAMAEGFAYVKAHPKDPKVMAGLGGAALLLIVIVVAIAAGTGGKDSEASGSKGADGQTSSATDKKGESATAGQAALDARACRITKESTRLAARASKDVPVEVAVNGTGDRARIGFSTDASAAQGLAIDLTSFKVTPEFAGVPRGKVRAVVPLAGEGKPAFAINAEGKQDKLEAWRTLSADPPIVVGWADNAVSVASKASEPPVVLWPLEGEGTPEAIRGADAGDLGIAIVLRRRGEIFGGMVGKDKAPRGGLIKVAGAGGPPGSPVGAPAIAVAGTATAVAFADRASSTDPWSLRIGSAALGSIPSSTSPFAVPSGGPGGAAIAPALGGLSDGRWLLVWTEGSGGDHDVRAQTLDAGLKPLGAPFSISREGHNAGQGAVGLRGGAGLVGYLRLTDEGYELWGAAVDCR